MSIPICQGRRSKTVLSATKSPFDGVQRSVAARDVLVLLLTDHEDVMRTPEGALFALALAVRIRAGSSDSYLPSGRIGRLDISAGCYTAYDVFRLAAQELARKGLARQVSALLRAGRQTVRDFLTERYGVCLGQREYFTPRGRTPDQADVSDFLRGVAEGVNTALSLSTSAPRVTSDAYYRAVPLYCWRLCKLHGDSALRPRNQGFRYGLWHASPSISP